MYAADVLTVIDSLEARLTKGEITLGTFLAELRRVLRQPRF